MIELAPWQTVAPSALALAIAGVGVGAGGWRVLTPRRPELAVVAGVFAVALLWRGLALPVERHLFDGHEAEYFDIFRGVRPVGRGGTLLYPLMQWGWWLAGLLLPHHPAVPLVLSAVVGAATAAGVALLGQRLGGRLAGAVVGLLLALDPSHTAWSLSAYNIVFPLAAGLVSVLAAGPSAGAPAAARAALGIGAAGVAFGLRLDVLVLPVVAAGLALFGPVGPAGPRWLARLGVLAAGGALLALVAAPIVFPGGVPGEGERLAMLHLQAGWLAPYGGPVRVLGWACWAAVALRVAPRWAVPVLGGLVLHHLLLATFDDLGERHALPATLLGLLLGAVAIGARPRIAAAGAVALLGFALFEWRGLRARFYASEEAFVERLTQPPWAALPRMGLAEARAPGCAWVAEDHRAAAEPTLSHFNLLSATEFRALSERFGCVRWCVELEDHRWSSRGVRDRARRTASLYAGMPLAVVEDPPSGYACLLMELTARREPLVGRTGEDLPLP